MDQLLETIASELERPRELPAQVINHLSGTYNLNRDAIGNFLRHELTRLEDYEIDLALSPVFTPTLRDQSIFADLLGETSVPATQWPALVQQLSARPTCAQLMTEDGAKISVPLREVSIERYVHRLRLDGMIPAPLYKLIECFEPASERSLLKAVARRAVWENAARREILARFLTVVSGRETYRQGDLVELLRLAETYQPADAANLRAQIPHWLQVLRQEINDSAGGRPFFNERVEELHGGGRDQRRQDNSRLAAKENERAFLERLQQILRD